MAGGASVRLDAGTRVRLASATLVELTRGGVYVDTGGRANGRNEVAIRTTAGLFQALGTQFEVRAEGGGAATRLRVREGSVRLDRGDDSVLTDTGQELIVRSDGSLDHGRTAAYGPEWDWVLKTAPILDIEGVKVRTFLDWIARETGRRVELSDEQTASLCDSTVLHGSIEHLTPADAPSVVLPSSGLGHRLSDGTLVVFVAKDQAP
jgi:ferric-dicitrate binding protein FerR (iron transport regulator)